MSETPFSSVQTVENQNQPQYVVSKGGEQFVPQVPNNLAGSPEARQYAIDAARHEATQAAIAADQVFAQPTATEAAPIAPAETEEINEFDRIPESELPLHLLRDGIATGRLRQERLVA
jgi:hypothetical protein